MGDYNRRAGTAYFTVLKTARRLYARQGFRIVETAMHAQFGVALQGETWRLDLG